MTFKKIDPKLNLPEEEKKVLEFWRTEKIFKKSLDKESPLGNFVFYEGPPTANGTPGIHHVEARSFKDLFNRYKTMQGFHVERKAGWDTHGLPVELQVEKELGISGKGQIENIVEGDKKASIEKFNELCQKSVWKYKDEWEKLTERMAYWIDMDNSYVTYDSDYIETVWWVISEINKRGFLYKGHKIVPYCPRCGTALSSHEVAQGYQKIKEESIYIKVRSKADPSINFLVWTTTPWTLSGNAALAFGPEIKYVLVESEDEKYILAKNRTEKLFGEFRVIGEYSGQDLVDKFSTSGADYEPLYPDGENFSEAGTEIYKLITASYVSDTDGTGIVHMAPAFGEEDFEHGHKQKNIKVLKTVSEKGESLAGAGRGKFVKDADLEVKADLESRGLLFKKEMFEHDYPFCWRCESPLLYMARDSWYIAMSKLRDELLANNAKINWNPSYLKDGRFGEWLANVNDWAISRDRYWGTPLPVWECDKCKEYKVVGDYSEIQKSNNRLTKIIFVRHGHSQKNAERVLSSTPDKWPLTDKGREGIQKLAEELDKNIDVIISSPILRAKQTAEIINEKLNLPIEFDDLAAEINVGEWNDLPKDERKATESYREYDKVFHDPEARYFHKLGRTGESREDLQNRALELLKKIQEKHAGKNVLVVGHGGMYPALMKIFHQIDYKQYFSHLDDLGHNDAYVFYIDQNGKPFDPHKPKVDAITFNCTCGGTMKRTSEVMDVWLDSGAMPYAQYHFPFENKKIFQEQFPADFITEAVDQTRGWFYTMLAISTVISHTSSYKNVISLGHVLDDKGKKMSKSKGNIVLPDEMFEKYGADVIRYYFYSVNQPGEPKLFVEKEIVTLSRNLFMTLWNVFSFFMTYASIDQFEPSGNLQSDNVLDLWILAKFNKLVLSVSESMNRYDAYKSSNEINEFVNELSTWYVRRSRRRFWKSESDADKNSAYETLYYILFNLTKILAPFAPMYSETVYQILRFSTEPESVHLCIYPEIKEIDENVIREMAAARLIVEAGLKSRAENGIKIRQPLQEITYSGEKLSDQLEKIIADEVNVKTVVNNSFINSAVSLDTEITHDLKIEGFSREIVRNIQELRKKSGFNVEDRITLSYLSDSADLDETMEKFGDLIGREVLAETINKRSDLGKDSSEYTIDENIIRIKISHI